MTELSIAKIKASHGHIGQAVFIPANEMSLDEMQKIPLGEIQVCTIKEITDKRMRSDIQNGLWWKCCTIVAENTDDLNWRTKEIVCEQVKIALRFYEYYIHYHNEKTGEMTLHIKTRSISFANLKHMDACRFFDEGYPILAAKIGLTVDELVDEAKSKMLKKGEYEI